MSVYVGLRAASRLTGIPESVLAAQARTDDDRSRTAPRARLWFSIDNLDALRAEANQQVTQGD
jgi:hypothetical protein